MKKTNKLTALALAAIIAAGSLGTLGVTAKQFTDVTEESGYTQQIDILSDIGVIMGATETEFAPNENVTREQMAILLFRLMLNKKDAGKVNVSAFTDLYDETYHGAISWASASGYIFGTSDKTFEPKKGIMLQDAMTMIVRALGQSSAQMNSGYPWTYIDAAIKLGLDKGLENVAYTDTLTRAQTAAILSNALTAEYLVPKTLSNGVTTYASTSIIENVFNYEMDTAQVVSTNDYTLSGTSVVKDNYITLSYTDDKGDAKSMTVNFNELGIDGSANDYIGHSLKLIYSVDSATKLVTVLSASQISKGENFDEVKMDADKKFVEIGGVKYNVVEKYSDALATNNNELLVYAYDEDGELAQLKTNAELSDALGMFNIELIFENGSETASRAILKNFKAGKIDIAKDGKINIAANKTSEELTGGMMNKAEAANGEYVLYYYNAASKSLEIHQTLEVKKGLVTRLTTNTAKLGDGTYTLGNANAGITADSLRAQLTVGREADLVMYKDTVVAIVGGVTVSSSSEYLLAMSAAVPVYSDGNFRYVVTANINGVTKNIFSANANVEAGRVYRYIETNETYTLIAPEVVGSYINSGAGKFVQNDSAVKEIAAMAAGAKITLNANTYYTLSADAQNALTSEAAWNNINFVTDANTVIIVNNADGIKYVNGLYASTITLSEDSKVTAIFRNETGAVETLKYLYVTNAALGNYDSSTQLVKVLSYSGLVFENGRAYSEYNVYNFANGAVEVKKSIHGSLENGKVYRTGTDGNVVDSEYTEAVSGFVSGYTSSTITINGTTYRAAADIKIAAIDANLNKTDKAIGDTYMNNVQFTAEAGMVKSMIILGAPQFAAVQSEGKIIVSTTLPIAQFDTSAIAVTAVKTGGVEVNASLLQITADTAANKLTLTPTAALTAGQYEITIRLGGKPFTINAAII